MRAIAITCPRCGATLLGGVLNRPDLSPCPSCGIPLQIETFPALFRTYSPGAGAEAVLTEGEAGCFYHPAKKAVHSCDACGRFICALCDCQLGGRHFCPACLELGSTRGRIKNLERERTLYDSIALSIAVLPVLVVVGIYFTFITAPIALIMAIRYWKAPLSLVRRSRIRFVLAMVFATVQIGAWIAVVIAILGRHLHA